MRTKNPESLAVGCRGAHSVAGGAVRVSVGILVAIGQGRTEATQDRVNLRVADLGQAVVRRPAGRNGCETLFHVSTLLFQVALHQGIDRESVVGAEVSALDKMVGERSGAIERPRLESSHELDLVDQPVLERQKTEEQIAIGSDGGHGAASLWAGKGYGGSVPGAGDCGRGTDRVNYPRKARP